MKLIDEKEIEIKAEKYSFTTYFTSSLQDLNHDVSVFKYGAEFAEQKLIPLMVEFTKFCELYYSSRVFPDETILWNSNGINYTTEELFEQFIKTNKNG